MPVALRSKPWAGEDMEEKIVVLDSSVQFLYYDRYVVGAKVVRGGVSGGVLTAEAAAAQAEAVNGETAVRAVRGVRSLRQNKDLVPPRGWRKWRPLEVAALSNLPTTVDSVEKTGTTFRRLTNLDGREAWTEWEEEVKSSRPFREEEVGAYMATRLGDPAAAGWQWDLERGFVSEVPR
jgi:hypothetical protein